MMSLPQRLLAVALCVGLCSAKQYDGVEVKLLTLEYMSDTFRVHAPKWEALTGAKVSFTLKDAFDEVIDEIHAEGESGIGHDAYLFTSTVMPEIADKGYLADLTDLVKNDVQLDWTDIVPFIRTNNVGFNRRVYGLPFDGDALLLVYRSDLMSSPPQTVEELVNEAIRLNGQDLNGDGIPDSGWCDCWGPSEDGTVYYIMGDMLMNVVTPYLQSKGSNEGAFFDPRTLDAMSHTEAWMKGFKLLMRLYKEGSDPVANRCDGRDGDNRYSHAGYKFQNGTCAFYSFWSSYAMIKANSLDSFAKPHLKHTVFPGSTEVNVDGKLTQCTAKECPYSTKKDKQGRMINSAPFAAYGGFIGTVANHSKNVQAAYDFLSYCNRPENSAYDVINDDGLEPWRTSQLLPQLWESKLNKSLVSSFLSTTREILNNENVVIDLRIPGAADFITEAGKIVDLAMRDVITVEQAPQALQDAWDAVIEKKGGRETLLPLYRKSLNLPPLQKTTFLSGDDFELETYQIALIVVGGVLVVIIIVAAVVRARRSHSMYEKQFNNNVIAERCASAIAAMEFEKVEYLNKLENPNGIQKAFMHIIKRIQEYKAYMPQALFAEDDTEDTQMDSETGTTRSQSRRSAKTSGRSASIGQSLISVGGANKVTQQLRMAATKKKNSIVSVHCDVAQGETHEVFRIYSSILDAVSSVTSTGNNGVLLYTSGDYTTVTLNAASQCATHQVKACQVGIVFKEMVATTLSGLPVGMGAATGYSIVANCGTKAVKAFMCIGPVLERARYLSKECVGYQSALVLADASVNETSQGQVETEAIAVLPADHGKEGRHQVVYNVLALMAGGEGDEWMYELGNQVDTITDAFAALRDHGDNSTELQKIKAHYLEKSSPAYTHMNRKLEERFGDRH